jgi:hypothetical protein
MVAAGSGENTEVARWKESKGHPELGWRIRGRKEVNREFSQAVDFAD